MRGKAGIALAVEPKLKMAEQGRRNRPIVGNAAIPAADPLQSRSGKRPSGRIVEVPDSTLIKQQPGTIDICEGSRELMPARKNVVQFQGELILSETALIGNREERVVEQGNLAISAL